MKGTFNVVGGQVLQVVVGEMGSEPVQGNEANGAGGGGGGTFVWTEGQLQPMIVAGGGGGSSLQNNGLPHYQGKPGVTTEDATGSRSDDEYNDSPGGQNGEDGQSVSGSGGRGWSSVLDDPSGVPACQNYGGDGGFGGGGGGGCMPNLCNHLHTAGGGGGYSGGGAGGTCYYHGGGGGGSYNTGSSQDNAAGVKSGNGQVEFTW
ncbi:hypothetical protein ENSA5_69520 [Enhygromyxa salina]|uniref:Uncharacterized protein n=1 Tax=Enhygromyxa salina TaxID=215803 RepID=A0A2S9XB70_9BACT|nr:hypothetical protein ENSA5_69520 [Enhygromyxa salina]